MNLHTDINPKYLIRLSIVSLMCIGMCLFCIYDGMVAWPSQQERYDEYMQFTEDNPDLDEKDLAEQWNEQARSSHGFTADKLREKRTDYEINQQFVLAGITGLIGLFFLGKLFGNWGCWIKADEDGLKTSEGKEVKFDDVMQFDKKLWQNKGIAKVLYHADGKGQKIVLDDCNYERDTTQAILRHLEDNIDHAKIINGKPEPPLKEDASANATEVPAGEN